MAVLWGGDGGIFAKVGGDRRMWIKVLSNGEARLAQYTLGPVQVAARCPLCAPGAETRVANRAMAPIGWRYPALSGLEWESETLDRL